jgi:hypothetical protein
VSLAEHWAKVWEAGVFTMKKTSTTVYTFTYTIKGWVVVLVAMLAWVILK